MHLKANLKLSAKDLIKKELKITWNYCIFFKAYKLQFDKGIILSYLNASSAW